MTCNYFASLYNIRHISKSILNYQIYFLFQVLVVLANPELSFSITSVISLGSLYAWKVVLTFYFYAFLSLKVPSKIFSGPATPNGYVPLYSANGFQYYAISILIFIGINWFYAKDSMPTSYLFLTYTFDLVICQCYQIFYEFLGFWVYLKQNDF